MPPPPSSTPSTPRGKIEKTTIVLLLILSIFLFIAITLFIFKPDVYLKKETNTTAIIQTDSSHTIIYDTVARTNNDSVFGYRKTATYIRPLSVSQKVPTSPVGTFKERFDTVYLYFILIFGALLLLVVLPRLIKFNISKDGVTADLSDKELEAINNAAEVPNTDTTRNTGAVKSTRALEKINIAETDPQKGLWGSSAVAGGRIITAEYAVIPNSDGWTNVTLKVKSTNDTLPLTGYVMFHLHPTFKKPNVKIFVIQGAAVLKFAAWGAFTVGVEADNGETFLELDLSKDEKAPSPFKDR